MKDNLSTAVIKRIIEEYYRHLFHAATSSVNNALLNMPPQSNSLPD